MRRAATFGAVRMTLPGFLCIGAQKAGTSWLFEQLKTHPDIWMPPIKELHYFNTVFVEEYKTWTKSHIQNGAKKRLVNYILKDSDINLSYVSYLASLGIDVFTENWYRNAFAWKAAKNRLTGDVTPAYSTIPEAGIRYIRSLLGPVKIIYLIRDPAARAISALKMRVARKGLEHLPAAEWRSYADETDSIDRGDYRTFVPRWKAHFPEGRILFLPFRRVPDEPAALLRDVEDFLAIGRHDYKRADKRVHASKNIAVPEEIVALLRERTEPQREFLVAEFGEDFVRMT